LAPVTVFIIKNADVRATPLPYMARNDHDFFRAFKVANSDIL